LGIADDLDTFLATLRSQPSVRMQRMDPEFLQLVTFNASIQRPFSLYFLARGLWASSEHGVAISALKEAWAAITTLTKPRLAGRAVPEIKFNGALQAMRDEVNEFKQHVNSLLQSWEKDNAQIYFVEVS
jgi:HAMP domain-containing protein